MGRRLPKSAGGGAGGPGSVTTEAGPDHVIGRRRREREIPRRSVPGTTGTTTSQEHAREGTRTRPGHQIEFTYLLPFSLPHSEGLDQRLSGTR